MQTRPLASPRVMDRHGVLLRELLNEDQARHHWVELASVSDAMKRAMIHAEDKRFDSHGGVDMWAIARAMKDNVWAGRVVSGASTITQQVIKLGQPQEPRTLRTKLAQSIQAIRLDAAYSKDAILEQYLNRAPFGNQLIGVESASQMYFDKPASELTLAEATFLAPIVRSPTRLNPYTQRARVQRAQSALLAKMLHRGSLTAEEHQRVRSQPIVVHPKRGNIHAPHFTEHLRTLHQFKGRPVLTSTMDWSIQQAAQTALTQRLHLLAGKRVGQGGVVVLDTQSAEVLAWVGSRDYWDKKAKGANDAVLAHRQPGSTLKPFVYAAFLDAGEPASSVLLDWHTSYATEEGTYIPRNYDLKFHGPVSMRRALGGSLNVPAVVALSRVGVHTMLRLLRSLGFSSMTQPAKTVGLGLALGNAEVRLIDLATAYTALGRGGRWMPHQVVMSDNAEPPVQVFSPDSSAIILDVLGDDEARELGFGGHNVFHLPYKVAAKTGTSVQYRDSWAVAMTPKHTVAVWLGNFDGTPTDRISGINGAAFVVRQVLHALYPQAAAAKDVEWFEPPSSLKRVRVCALTGKRPNEACPHTRVELMRSAYAQRLEVDTIHTRDSSTGDIRLENLPGAWVSWAHARGELLGPQTPTEVGAPGDALMLSPLEGEVFFIDPDVPAQAQQLLFRAELNDASLIRSGNGSVTWFVDGVGIGTSRAPFEFSWMLSPGHHTIGVGGTGSSVPHHTVNIEVHAP